MPDLPEFLIRPPFRCHELGENGSKRACGKPAQWAPSADDSERRGFYCQDHKRESDQRILDTAEFRRVSVTLEVVFNATSFDEAAAIAEVVRTAEVALERAGGLVNLHTTHSQIGRWRASRQLRASLAARGSRL